MILGSLRSTTPFRDDRAGEQPSDVRDLVREAWSPFVLENHWWVVLELVGVPVAIGGFNPSMDIPWIGPAYIKPEFRGRGLYKHLLAARLAALEAVGKKVVETAVDLSNTASLRNLIKAGFQIDRYEPTHDHVVVRKTLEASCLDS
jgi:GNAT superfamily N-acetyltransferase